jgi:N-acetylmuramic acid 6-phosphate etherase
MPDSATPSEPHGSHDRSLRATERRHPQSGDIDTDDTARLVDLFLTVDAAVPAAVARARRSIIEAIERIEHAFRHGGRLFYVGAGTSGRLGMLDATECPPTFGTPPDMVQGIIAGGSEALLRSVEGAEDDLAAGAAAIDDHQVSPGDIVVGIAASGTTPYVRAALGRGETLGATCILVTCSAPPAPLVEICDTVIQVDVGPEVVTGSTRLKAGTATKLVLNMLTTGAMVRLGKTYGNLMVDLLATNAKLRDRGERIVMEILGVGREAARDAIERAGGSVRTAIVMLHDGLDRAAAETRLEAVDHRLRAVIGPPPPPRVEQR